MTTIKDVTDKYRNRIDFLDLELILANSLKKTREFVLIHPEQAITKIQETKIKKLLERRETKEPIAYILGQKEFYGLNFIVNKHTLIPRPETELMVEDVLVLLRSMPLSKTFIVDIGTGSGCIITSVAKEINNFKFYGTDISKQALIISKKNAKLNGIDKKIKFLHGSLLEPILSDTKKLKPEKLILLANLPYLSKEIYSSAPIDVKKFEPKSALYSPEDGLQHYRKLLKQIKELISVTSYKLQITGFLEISPEQKNLIKKIIKEILPKTKIEFKKDLAGKWRVCKIQTN